MDTSIDNNNNKNNKPLIVDTQMVMNKDNTIPTSLYISRKNLHTRENLPWY